MLTGDEFEAHLRSLGRLLVAVVVVLLVLAFFVGRCSAAEDALDEVNAARAKRQLPPFERVECLTVAAKKCADYRAEHQMSGHTRNDFAYLPQGCHAEAAGCAGWRSGDGFGACCMFENWKYAGAAFAIGRDGIKYCHLFVRGRVGNEGGGIVHATSRRNRLRR